MLRAVKVAPFGAWPGQPVDSLKLDHQQRHRRRIAMTAEGGLRFVLDLPQATMLRDGDGLVLEDGRVVAVRARPEELIEVTGRDGHHLARLAWHLGNRHVPAAIEAERILIAPDPVLRQMLLGLGATIRDVMAPFDPEPGAYSHHTEAGEAAHHHDRQSHG